MRQKNKYLIKRWCSKQFDNRYDEFQIEGNAELIWWKRILKTELKVDTITKYEITKIE